MRQGDRVLCSQAANCDEDPAAGKLIIGTHCAVLKLAMVDIVGRCAAGRGWPRSELSSEPVRGRKRRARGTCVPIRPGRGLGQRARAHGRRACALVLCTTLYYTMCDACVSRAEIAVCEWSVCHLKYNIMSTQVTAG